MKKALILLAVFLIFIAGCDQKPPMVATPVTPAVSIFTLNGKVFQYDYLKNAADLSQPLAGVTVTAVGTMSVVTSTSTLGAYSFGNLPLGQYTIIISKEGYQKDGKTSYSNSYDYSNTAYAGTLQTLDFNLDPRPVFLGTTFADYAEVPAATRTYKLNFSEAMDAATVTGFIKLVSLRSAGVSSLGIQDSALSWDTDKKCLSVTANTDLTPDALYQIGLACSNAGFGIEGLRDASGYPIYGTQPNDNDVYSSAIDPHYGAYIYVPFKTISDKAGAPPKPTGLAYRGLATGSTEVDYDSVYASLGGITLTFTGSADANGYRLYVSSNNIDYSLCKEFSTPAVAVIISDVVGALGGSVAHGYDTYGYPIDPGLPWPFLGAGTYLKVLAYNSKGEGPYSDPLLVVDTTCPTLNATAVSETSTVKIIKFTEPLDRTTAENKNNYFIAGGATTVDSVSLINDYSYSYSTYKTTYVRLNMTKADAGPRSIRASNLKDLTGNVMKTPASATY